VVAVLTTLGVFLVVGLVVLGVVALRTSRVPTPRRREYLRMLRQYRAAKLALHAVTRKTNAWRPSLDEIGLAYANDVTEIVVNFDRQTLALELDRSNRGDRVTEETDRDQS
jgi:hypothetical protein